AFAQFAGTSASQIQPFTNDPADVAGAVARFQSTPDSGNTPYDAALRRVRDMISSDQRNGSAKDAGYVIIMISDGSPTNSSYISLRGDENLKNDVEDILKEAPKGLISINTVYLFNDAQPTASERSYLQRIAS